MLTPQARLNSAPRFARDIVRAPAAGWMPRSSVSMTTDGVVLGRDAAGKQGLLRG